MYLSHPVSKNMNISLISTLILCFSSFYDTTTSTNLRWQRHEIPRVQLVNTKYCRILNVRKLQILPLMQHHVDHWRIGWSKMKNCSPLCLYEAKFVQCVRTEQIHEWIHKIKHSKQTITGYNSPVLQLMLSKEDSQRDPWNISTRWNSHIFADIRHRIRTLVLSDDFHGCHAKLWFYLWIEPAALITLDDTWRHSASTQHCSH